MRIATVDDIDLIDSLLNDPFIRPHISAGSERICCSTGFNRLVMYVSEDGIVVLEPIGDCEYIVMCGFRKESAGLRVASSLSKVSDDLFFNGDVFRVFSTTTTENLRSSRVSLAFGMSQSAVGNRVISSVDYARASSLSRLARSVGEAVVNENGLDVHKDVIPHLGAFVLTSSNGYVVKANKWFGKFAKLSNTPQIKTVDFNAGVYSYAAKEFILGYNRSSAYGGIDGQ